MADILQLQDIPDDFSASYLVYLPTLRQKQRATAFVKDSYVKSVSIFRAGNERIAIKSNVYRSQRKSENPHTINLDVNETTRKLEDAHCSCKAGISGKCAHVLTVVMMIEQWKILGYKAVPSQPSSTSLPQQWDKPRGPKIKAEPVSQMIISRPMNLTRKRKPVIATFIDNRNIEVCDEDIIHLKQLKLSPISYLVEELGSSTTLDTPVGPQLLGSPLSYHGLFEMLPRERRLPEEELKEAEKLVSLQVNNKLMRDHLQDKTGKKVILKDISNIISKVNASKKSDNIESLVSKLKKTEDSLGQSEVAAICLLNSEEKPVLQHLIKCFQKHNPDSSGIKVIMADKDIVERDVFKEEFPDASLLICKFHVLRTFNREITTEKMGISSAQRYVALELIQKLVHSSSEEDYNANLKLIETTCPRQIFNYIDTNWHNIYAMNGF
ncbi:Hypothetical predicted protein [Mytilus galloprovincialis]|uniref:SWIM-type domain-containing protein n=1 Tax=Mytilus galloprovincialis TaxID=29158 RepID=A0A8B6EUT8_MYTGA|nr:Hypothetical predicted protein [Mytilus galloprovincialis]